MFFFNFRNVPHLTINTTEVFEMNHHHVKSHQKTSTTLVSTKEEAPVEMTIKYQAVLKSLEKSELRRTQ